MEQFKQFWANLPYWAKIAIVVLAFIIIYRLILRFGAGIKSAGAIARFQGEADNWKGKGEELSYPPSTYRTMANALYEAMDSQWYNPFSYGTGEDEVYAQFEKLNNNLDFIELQKAFGNKDGDDLETWIYGDLNQGEIDKVNDILQDRGIQYRF